MPAAVVAPPLIAECPVNVECKVISVQTVGDHDLFLGEVAAAHVDDDILNADGGIATDRLDPLAYMEGEYWSLGQAVASHGFSGGGLTPAQRRAATRYPSLPRRSWNSR